MLGVGYYRIGQVNGTSQPSVIRPLTIHRSGYVSSVTTIRLSTPACNHFARVTLARVSRMVWAMDSFVLMTNLTYKQIITWISELNLTLTLRLPYAYPTLF